MIPLIRGFFSECYGFPPSATPNTLNSNSIRELDLPWLKSAQSLSQGIDKIQRFNLMHFFKPKCWCTILILTCKSSCRSCCCRSGGGRPSMKNEVFSCRFGNGTCKTEGIARWLEQRSWMEQLEPHRGGISWHLEVLRLEPQRQVTEYCYASITSLCSKGARARAEIMWNIPQRRE